MPSPEDFPPAVRDRIHAAMLAQDAAKRTRPAQAGRACAETGLKPRANRAAAQMRPANRLPRGESPLEIKFSRLWGALAPDIALVRQYRFDLSRRWKADFCHEATNTLIECEGIGKGHQGVRPFIDNAEKYLEAELAGYRVLRLTCEQINAATLARIRDFIHARL